MIKLFFLTFFTAELIIAVALVLKIYQFDKCVNKMNNLILANSTNITPLFEDIRTLIQYFSMNLTRVRLLVRQKKDEYFIKIAKTALIYSSIFLLKGKYKKTVFAYQLAKEVYEGIKEA